MQIRKMKVTLIASAMVVGLVVSGGARAAVDTFLKIDGIDGESADDRNKGASDILAWSFSMVGAGAGKRGCIQGIEVIKSIDSASPRMITNAATGTAVSRAVLKVRKPGEARGEFLVITMSNVLISSYRVTSNDGQSGLSENVTLSFDQMDGAYRKQNPDGSLGTAIPWSIGPSGAKCG